MLKSLLSLYHKLLQVMKNNNNFPQPTIPQSEEQWQDGLANFDLQFVLFNDSFAICVPLDDDLNPENCYTTKVFMYPHGETVEVNVYYFDEGNDIKLIKESHAVVFALDALLYGLIDTSQFKWWQVDRDAKDCEAERIRQEKQDEADYEDGKLISVRDETTGDYSYRVNPRYRF